MALDINKHAYAIMQDSQLLYSAEQVQQAIATMVKAIRHDLADQTPLLLAVMGGAVYFTGQLLPHLDFPLQFDYLQATRYGNHTSGSELIWKVEPPESVAGRVVLILDDILDQGVTLHAIKQRCLEMGAAQVKIAVLFEKRLANSKPVQADYIGLELPDKYVFGCGMDVYGWWRNLAEVRAMN
jgi:hypoxanthine phosphoribosyltransferase